MDLVDDACVIFHQVEPLVDGVDAGLRDGFETEEQLFAAAAGGQLQEFIILPGVDAGLAAPPFVVRRNGSEQVFGIFQVSGNIIVPKDDHLTFERGILRRHLRHRPPANLVLIYHRQSTKIAVVGTAAGGKQHPIGVVAAVIEMLERLGCIHQGWDILGLVELLRPAAFKIGQVLLPQAFGLAHKDCVEVESRFVWEQGGVRSAGDQRDAALPEAIRDAVGVAGAGSVESNPHQVNLGLKIDRFSLFVDVQHLPGGRGQGRQVGHGDLLEVEKPRPADAADIRRRGSDQQQLQRKPR